MTGARGCRCDRPDLRLHLGAGATGCVAAGTQGMEAPVTVGDLREVGRHGMAGSGVARLVLAWHGSAGTAWQGSAWLGRHGLARLGWAGRGWVGHGRQGGAWSGQAGQGQARLGGAWLGKAGQARFGGARRGWARPGMARHGGAWRAWHGKAVGRTPDGLSINHSIHEEFSK